MKLWLALLLLSGCSAPSTIPNPHIEQTLNVSEQPEQIAPREEDQPRFVVISKNSPIFLAPSEEAPRLLFRTEDAQQKLEAKWHQEIQDWAAKTQTKFAKEMVAEKHRMKRMKSSEARHEYSHKRRESRARRYLKDIEKRAKRIGESPQSRFIVLQKIEQKGDWIEVVTLNAEEESLFCYENGLPGLRGAKLRGWVKEDALKNVTTERQRYPVWRGSEVKLAAGVVIENQHGESVAHVDGFKIRLKIDSGELAREFSPGPLFESPYTASVFSDVALAEGHLGLSQEQTLPYNPFVDLYVIETLWVDSTFFATTQTPCGEFTVHAEESLLVPTQKRRPMLIDGGMGSATPPFARRGASLYDVAGGKIAEASIELSLGTPHTANKQGHQCFEKHVWTHRAKQKKPEDWGLIWCVAPEDIKH